MKGGLSAQPLAGGELACMLGLLYGICTVHGAEEMSLKMDHVLFGWDEVFQLILKEMKVAQRCS